MYVVNRRLRLFFIHSLNTIEQYTCLQTGHEQHNKARELALTVPNPDPCVIVFTMHNIAAHSEHKTKLQTLLKLRNIDVNSIARLKRDSTLYKNFAE